MKKQSTDNRVTFFTPLKEELQKQAKKKYPHNRSSLNDLLREITAVYLKQAK